MHAHAALLAAVTDAADPAIVLPVNLLLAAWIAATGWTRGAIAWICVIGTVLSAVGALKIFVASCSGLMRPFGLYSPSGHTVAAALLAGGVVILVQARRERRSLNATYAAAAAALIIGLTRVALAAHTSSDVAVAAPIGIGGVWLLSRLMGVPSRDFSFLGGGVILTLAFLLLYGTHTSIEPLLKMVSAGVNCPLESSPSGAPKLGNSMASRI